MKAKVSRGGGFRGALNYVFDVGKEATHTKNAERVGGNMAGNDPRELSREFSAVRQLRPDIGKPVWHCSLSLPPGERLSAEKWEAVTTDFMQRMGFDQTNTPWVAVRHQDTDKDHIHIVASRVGLDGKVWLGQWEARSAIEATQELEHTHGLTLTPGLGDARAERRKLTDKEINMAVRTGDEPPRQRLQRLLDEAVKDKPTAPELADRLHAAGVGVRANLASTGRMNGFSFEVAGVPFKGSDLGKGYTWAGLQKSGVTYDEARDRAGLERFRPTVADRGERQDVAAVPEPDARGLEAPTGRSLDRDGADLGTAGPTPTGRDAGSGSLRQGDG
ncbi:relaxase/mobilization nuclease domain-containing protein, partial [Salmonella enterica]